MYNLSKFEIKDSESARKTAEELYRKAGKKVEDYYDKNGCVLLAAVLLYLSRKDKLDADYLYRFGMSVITDPNELYKKIPDTDITDALPEIKKIIENNIYNVWNGISFSFHGVLIYISNYHPFTLDDYTCRRKEILRKISALTKELKNLTKRYTETCPQSEWIGKRVHAYAVTETPGELKDAGTGYLKGIHHLEGNLFYYQIFLENEDGTPSQDTYTGPIIVKVELFEN